MFIWFSTMTLMVEATRVIELRLQLIAIGRSTPDEIFLMVTEKIDAFEQAKSLIIRGGDPSLIIDNYRKIVAANVARLSGTGGLGIVGSEASIYSRMHSSRERGAGADRATVAV